MTKRAALGAGERPRVLGLLMLSDYGLPERGPGYEYFNFLPALQRLPVEYRNFDFAQAIIDDGYWAAGAELRSIVETWKPHLLFFCTYTEQVDRDVMRWISENTPTVTIGWFSDDHWRFDSYSRYWARALDWVVTTDVAAVPKYHAIGHQSVILSQWAANEMLYRPSGLPLAYDITFVGQCYGSRASVVGYLRSTGVHVDAFGPGWPNGRVSQEQMMEIFSTSRINLNVAASSRRRVAGAARPQIKGRVFEVPACGGLLLTDPAPDLARYYEPGREIVVYESMRHLARLVHEMLSDEPGRAAIASAGYDRTLREHTWVKRLTAIFDQVGIPLRTAAANGAAHD